MPSTVSSPVPPPPRQALSNERPRQRPWGRTSVQDNILRREIATGREIQHPTRQPAWVVVVVLAYIQGGRLPRERPRVHQIGWAVAHVAGRREVGRYGGDEAERVHELVEHGELEVPWWAGRRARERICVAGRRARWRALQVERRDPPRQSRRPSSAAARERTSAIIIDRVDLRRDDKTECREVLLDRITHVGAVTRHRCIRARELRECDVERALVGVQSQRPPAGLPAEP